MHTAQTDTPSAPQAEFRSLQDAMADQCQAPDGFPSAGRTEQTQPLTDEQREEAIRRAGKAMEHHMALYAASNNFADRGDADRARRLMEQLIAGRSPEAVRRMEAQRGLA